MINEDTMAARTNSQFLCASLTEFIAVWAQGGEASLNLTTRSGITNVQLNCTLGHPGAPYSFPPSSFPSPTPAPPPRGPRHRGPAEKEKNRLRAARYQAARTAAPVFSTPTSSSSSTDSVTTSSSTSPVAHTATIAAPVTSSTAADTSSFQCEQCDYTSNTEHGVKVHKGHQHKNSQNPEELRGECHNNSLNMSLPSEEREENTSDSNNIMNNSNFNEADLTEPKSCECREAETGYYPRTGKIAWHRGKETCTICANSST